MMKKGELIRLLKLLGYGLDLDRWDEPDKNYMRFKLQGGPEDSEWGLIVYKDNEHTGIENAGKMLVAYGKYLKVQQIISID